MAGVTTDFDVSNSGGGRNSLLSPTLDVPDYNNNNSIGNGNAQPPSVAPQVPGADGATPQDNFGDLLAQLLRSLPAEASSLFIKSLSGLSTRESGELCAYVAQLKAEKQFRVIRAMAESTIDGKKKFLDNLRKKFALQREKEQQLHVQEEQELEEHMRRKQALSGTSSSVSLSVCLRLYTFAHGSVCDCECSGGARQDAQRRREAVPLDERSARRVRLRSLAFALAVAPMYCAVTNVYRVYSANV